MPILFNHLTFLITLPFLFFAGTNEILAEIKAEVIIINVFSFPVENTLVDVFNSYICPQIMPVFLFNTLICKY